MEISMKIDRNMMKRSLVGSLALILSVAGLWLTPATASAEEVQITGPLAGAPACRNCRIYREGRIALAPSVGFTLQDEYDQALLFGATATYHITDWLGAGVYFGYGGLHFETSLTEQVQLQGITTERNRLSLPSREFFSEQIGQIAWIAAPQITFIPLRGKLALFQKLFVDTDFFINVGVGIVGVSERADVDQNSYVTNCTGTVPALTADGSPPDSDNCVRNTQNIARTSRVAITGTFSAGLTMYFNDFLALTLEWRGMPFAWNTSGTDQGSPDDDFPDNVLDENDRIFHMNQMVAIGLNIFLPTEARVSE
jgi:outer membrane beta-barrel protein